MPKRKIATPRDTFDEPWKQIVQALFPQYLAFFAPDLAAEIDWNHAPEFRDKELRSIAKGFRRRRSTADFLVIVRRVDGGAQWLIIHIELQAQKVAGFPLRMFLYNVRAFDLHKIPVASLAVLADTDPDWRPNAFGYGEGASRVQFEYRVVKLLDYRDRQEELETSENPFGLAVLAHLKTQETKGDAERRLEWKVRLVQMLARRRWSRTEIAELFQFFDWILTLPEALEETFEARYKAFEREETMADIMSPMLRREHNRGKLEGREEGARRLLLDQLTAKFGPHTQAFADRVLALTPSEFERIAREILTAESLDALGL